MLILEALDSALARRARIYGELVGYGASCDAYHSTLPAPNGEGAARAMREALRAARIEPAQVGYINAHGTSTRPNDRIETDAIKAVFGAHAKSGLAVSSSKSMLGHSLGAAGGVEAVISVLALTHSLLPPTINYHEPDPDCDLDYIPNVTREVAVDVVMSNCFGFGGTNAVLLFRRFHG